MQLRDGLGPNFTENKEKQNNSDIIMKIQQLSTTMRAIHDTGNEIGYTLFGLMPPTPPSPTPIPAGLANVADTITKMIPEFQDLRQYGQTGRDLVAVIYGRSRRAYFRFCTRCWASAQSFSDNSSSRSEREPTFNRQQTRRILWSLPLPAGSWVSSITSRSDNPPRYRHSHWRS